MAPQESMTSSKRADKTTTILDFTKKFKFITKTKKLLKK